MDKREERFLRVIPSLAEVPVPFHPMLDLIEDKDEISRIIIIPKQEYPLLRTFLNIQLPFGWKIVPQRVFVSFNDRLEIYGLDPSGTVKRERIEIERIFSVGIGSHLLYAYVDIAWSTPDGIQSIRIEFNAVGERIMRERLDVIRARISEVQAGIIIDSEKVQDFLQDKNVPIKFRNYAAFSLVYGERLAQLFYQPAMRGKKILGPPLSPNRLFTLTDRHLIVLDEDYSVASNYSIVTHFYPLKNLKKIRIKPGDDYDELHYYFNKDGMDTMLVYPMQKERVRRIQSVLMEIPIPG